MTTAVKKKKVSKPEALPALDKEAPKAGVQIMDNLVDPKKITKPVNQQASNGKKSLVNFFDMLCLRNDLENTDALLNITTDKIESYVVLLDNSMAIHGSVTGEFEEFGEVALAYLPNIKKIINELGDDFTIKVTGNKLVLATKKTKVSIPIKNKEYIVNKLDSAKFNTALKNTQGDITFTLDVSDIDNIIKKCALIKSNEINLIVKDKNLYLKTKNKQTDFDLVDLIMKLDVPDFNIKVPVNFVTLLQSIDGIIEISLNKNKLTSLSVSYKTENLQFDYVMALVIQD